MLDFVHRERHRRGNNQREYDGKYDKRCADMMKKTRIDEFIPRVHDVHPF